MTPAADTAAEKAFEALLAGRPVPPGVQGFGSVAAFTGAVRATATQPGRPNAALAELLTNGLIVDQPSPSSRTAKRRRRRMWFFTAIIAKIASAGAVAQAATGAAIVLVGFTGAGAAGVLPTSVQHTFATVVDHVTPLTAPDPEQSAGATTTTATSSSATDTTSSSATATDSTSATQASQTQAAPADMPAGFDCDLAKPFGACVSEHAKHHTLPAGQVSLWARYYQAHRTDKSQAEQSQAQETPDATESDSVDSGSPGTSDAPQRSTAPTQAGERHSQDSQSGSGHGDH